LGEIEDHEFSDCRNTGTVPQQFLHQESNVANIGRHHQILFYFVKINLFLFILRTFFKIFLISDNSQPFFHYIGNNLGNNPEMALLALQSLLMLQPKRGNEIKNAPYVHKLYHFWQSTLMIGLVLST